MFKWVTPMNRRRPLLTFAFVGEALSQTNDILSGLLPIFQPLIAELHGQIYHPGVLAARVTEVYGLDVTEDVIAELTPRLVLAGLIHRVDSVAEVYRCEAPQKKLTKMLRRKRRSLS